MRGVWPLVALVLCASGCSGEGGDGTVRSGTERPAGEVRPPAVAGQFYPGNPDSLARDVDRFIAAAGAVEVDGDVVGIVAPHAGYVYSGGVAGHAYAAVKGRAYDTVVVVAPSHRVAFRGTAVYAEGAYRTPLGTVPVDAGLAAAILDSAAGIVDEPRVHRDEHSLEVQVPFLQRALGRFSIVPVIMGDQSHSAVRALGGRIASAVAGAPDRRVLLVASTDLSHYHDQRTAERLDGRVVEAVAAFDPDGLVRLLASAECEACGGGPTAAVMTAALALGADESRVLAYATSGDVTGDTDQVVGYMSAVFVRPASAQGAARPGGTGAGTAPSGSTGLTPHERKTLLALARASIADELGLPGSSTPPFRSPVLDAERGAFVTLHEHGQLRGCIGYVRAVRPLREAVAEMAVQAAFHDPRFPPVTADELADIDIEISVLSPLEVVTDVSRIETGRDGLVVQEGTRSGLLLPQVATEQGWDRETFLDHTCLKAGLPAGSWRRKGVVIMSFTAEVFGETDEGRGR
jgi:AmmeMemoRadiSam system protein B/AmmeMemoRadiSam system protein A